MTALVPSTDIERIVGVKRHQTEHWGRAVSREQRVYILHSRECLDAADDLRRCPYSLALDDGIDPQRWTEDVPLLLAISDPDGEAWLEPASPQPSDRASRRTDEAEHGLWDKEQQRYEDGCKSGAAAHIRSLCEKYAVPHEPDATGWCPVCETQVPANARSQA